MSVKFNHTAHKEMWIWLSENPNAPKVRWPGWSRNGGKYDDQLMDCFACDSCYFSCHNCPLVWPEDLEEKRECWDEGGLFDNWNISRDCPTRVRLALQIANLPVKDGVETI